MHVNRDDDELEAPRQWTVVQFALACVGTMSVTTFTKYPLTQYYGGAWSLICFLLYLLAGAGAILYVQLRVSAEHCRSQISLFSRYLPFTKAVSIAFMVRNLLQVAEVATLMAHMLSYIMFGLYRCDGNVCVGSQYMWSTCYDAWNTPQCSNMEQRVRMGPTPEDQFFQNYVLAHPKTWDSSAPVALSASYSVPLGVFPTWLNIFGLENTLLFAAWLAIALCVIWGPRFFGLLLYAIAPAALLAFFIVCVYTLAALARFPYANDLLGKFYGQMSTIMSLLTTQVDPYHYQPLEWGFLSSMVCMTQAMQLWSGQWSSMAKWTGFSRMNRHILPIIAVVVFGALGQLPTVLTCAFLSAGYEMNYVRLHLIKPFAVFFIIVPRIFGMWGVHPSIMVIWFAAVFLLALISNCLLILTTVDNIVDDLRRHSRKVERSPEKARRWTTAIICLLLYFLGVLFITRSGIFFVMTIDYYIDLLLVVLIPFAAAAYYAAFNRTKEVDGKEVKRTERVIISVLYFFGVIVSLAAFAHLLITSVINTPVPSYDDVKFPKFLVVLGWIVAAIPIVLGLLLGVPLALREAARSGIDRCTQFWTGQAFDNLEDSVPKPGHQVRTQLLNPRTVEADIIEESIDPM